MNFAVFASGRGTNFSAIVRAVKAGKIKANLSLLVCDNPKALVIKRAKRAGIKIALVKEEGFSNRKEFEDRIIGHLEENQIELIVLAGFMRLLSPEFVSRYKNKILNIHPALLPCFKGTNGIADAFNYGVKISGVTVHFVDEKTDHGPIVLQAALPIKADDTQESLEKRIHALEHQLYPKAISLFVEGRLSIEGRRVKMGG